MGATPRPPSSRATGELGGRGSEKGPACSPPSDLHAPLRRRHRVPARRLLVHRPRELPRSAGLPRGAGAALRGRGRGPGRALRRRAVQRRPAVSAGARPTARSPSWTSSGDSRISPRYPQAGAPQRRAVHGEPRRAGLRAPAGWAPPPPMPAAPRGHQPPPTPAPPPAVTSLTRQPGREGGRSTRLEACPGPTTGGTRGHRGVSLGVSGGGRNHRAKRTPKGPDTHHPHPRGPLRRGRKGPGPWSVATPPPPTGQSSAWMRLARRAR